MPIVTIIRPNWLDVEKATIFLMSFWVRAKIAFGKERVTKSKEIPYRS